LHLSIDKKHRVATPGLVSRRLPIGRIVIVLLALLTSAPLLRAQDGRPAPDTIRTGGTTEGKEFWVVFQKNFRDFTTDEATQALKPAEPLELQLFITASKTAHGYIEIKGIGFRKEFTELAGHVEPVRIDTAAQLRSSDKIEELGIHIVSDEPIAVYGLSRRFQTTDTYLAYPVDVLGTSYRAMCYSWLADDLLAQMAVIATQDNTKIRITPSVPVRSSVTGREKKAGVPFEITLNKGQAYQIIPRWDPGTSSDLTGTLLESSAPVAVFSGHNCAYVPDIGVKACNLLVEQLPPINSWGRQFFVGTLAGRSSSVLRVLASTDSTLVYENNRLVKTLNAGEYYQNTNQTQHTMITSNNPVLVAQYSKGYANGDSVGDPMMIIVAPTEQFLTSYRFATPIQGSWQHYINLIVPTASLPQLRLDGQIVDPTQFQQFGLSRYSIAQVKIDYGTHVLTGSEPFGLYSYGFGYDDMSYDAYGNGGGQSMVQVRQAPDTIAPIVDASYNWEIRSIKGIVRDDRINDAGISEITLLEYDNLTVAVPPFQQGAPQVPVPMKPLAQKQNAYARFRLRDKAGNERFQTICVKYDSFADSLVVSVLQGDETCNFSSPFFLGGYLKYSVLNNNVTIPVGSPALNNVVELQGNHGVPVWGIGAHFDYPYDNRFQLVGRVGLDFWRADLYGYFPDSLRRSAPDGTLLAEEFKLHRTTVLLTLSPGVQYFFNPRRVYLFGMLDISLPVYVSEKLTRSIVAPSNFVYDSGEPTLTDYEGGGPSGLAILLKPEIGIGTNLDLPNAWQFFGELGAGYGLTSLSPERDWNVNYLFARAGAKKRF